MYIIYKNEKEVLNMNGTPRDICKKMNKIAYSDANYSRDVYRVKFVENGKIIGIWNGAGDVYKGSDDRAKCDFIVK